MIAIRKITSPNHDLLVLRKVSWIGPKVLSTGEGQLSAKTTSQFGPAANVRNPPLMPLAAMRPEPQPADGAAITLASLEVDFAPERAER